MVELLKAYGRLRQVVGTIRKLFIRRRTVNEMANEPISSEQMAKEDITTLNNIGTVLMVLFCVGVALYTVIAITCLKG